MEKNENGLRFACSVIQMQIDCVKECDSSDYWKYLNELLRSITPNVEVIDNDKK